MLTQFNMVADGLVAQATRTLDPVYVGDLNVAVKKVRQVMVDLRDRLDNIDPKNELNENSKLTRRVGALRDARAQLDHLETVGAPWAKTREDLRRELEPRAPDGDPTVRAVEAMEIRQVLMAELDPLKRDLLFREAIESGDEATILAVTTAPKILQRRLVSDLRIIDEGKAALGRAQNPGGWKVFQGVDQAYQTFVEVVKVARQTLQSLGIGADDPLAHIAAQGLEG